jgi:hypothetical protein
VLATLPADDRSETEVCRAYVETWRREVAGPVVQIGPLAAAMLGALSLDASPHCKIDESKQAALRPILEPLAAE